VKGARRAAPSAPKHAPGARRAPFVLLLLGLVVGALCALLALNTASAANEVRRHDLAARNQSVAAQVVQLQNDQQASAAPGNLAAAAAALGMVPAGNPAFLEIDADGRVHVLGSPGPASYVPLAVPTPSKTKKPKPTATPTATPSNHTSTSAGPHAATSSTSAAKTSAATTPTKTPKPTPTPSPTPNTTLPGGTR
jgi:hypothetical protein